MPTLQQIYASNPVDDQRYITLQFIHPAFTKAHRLVLNHNSSLSLGLNESDSSLYEFIPVPGEVVPPKLDSTGRQDISIALDGVSLEVAEELDLVADAAPAAIQCIFSEYVASEPEAPAKTLVATLVDPQITETRFSASARFSDLLNMALQPKNYSVNNSPGVA